MAIKIRALPKDRTVIFDGLRGFSRHPTDPDRFEFVGTFLEPTPNRPRDLAAARRFDIQVPLIFLPMFHDNSAWQDQSLIAARRFNRMSGLKSTKLSTDRLSDRFIHRFGTEATVELSSHVVGADELDDLPRNAKVDPLGTSSVGPISIAWGEFVRFYLCSFGMILPEILKCAQSGGDLSYLCEKRETHLVDGTLFMTPRAHLSDRASILQAGMLIADEELRREVLRIARMLTGDALGLSLGPFAPRFPQGTSELKVQYGVERDNLRDSKGVVSRFRRVSRIRADYRSAQFERIVVELPTAQRGSDDAGGEDEVELRYGIRTYADVELAAHGRGGKGQQQLSAPIAWQRFRDGFPAYSDVVVDVVPGRERRLVPLNLPRRFTPQPEGEVTVGGMPDPNGSPQLRPNSRNWIDPDPPDRELLGHIAHFEFPIAFEADDNDLPFALRQLANAGRTLSAEPSKGSVLDSPRCFLVPRSWGSYALMANGQSRRFLTFAFDALPGVAHVIDFERGSKDQRTSIGILAKSSGRMMEDAELFTCVRAAVRHIAGSSRHVAVNVHNQTIWPSSSSYIDVSSRSLRHRNSWLRDPDRLALALAGAAEQLFD